jgi:PKD repeat protein
MGTKLRILTAAAALAVMAGCTVKKADKAPSLTGPSDNATSLQLQITPDTIFQDGASQALVTISAFGPDGSPARNLSLLTQISVGGTTTDFGRLSARSLVTDANGKATVTYTAPPSSLRTAINLPNAVVGDTAVFTANVTDSAGVDASGQVASFQWNFGDGTTATGRTVSHTYSQPGNYAVSLTIIDALGRVGGTTQSLTVAGGTNPTATFFTTPSSPNVGQQITFNASQALAAPGHTITSYAWDFGDGTTGSGVQTTHAYTTSGSFTVILITTDDVGRKGTQTLTISVGAAGLTADFTFSPSSPAVGQSVSFDASTSKASTGRTITSYAWNFDDGTTGSGAQTSHAYNRTGSFNVRLTVTDDLGQSQSVTKSVTVGGSTPSAAFTFSPSSPRRGQTVNFDASASRAASGRAIATYAWNFDDGAIAFGVTTQHAFANNGTFNVRLTITDDIGQTSTVTQAVTVADANPTASFTFSPSTPATGDTVTFDASASSPSPGRTIVAYQWNFDDLTTGTGRTVQHQFATARSYLVRLTVTDDFGNTATTSQSVTVTQGTTPPPPTARFTFSPSTPTTNQTVSFDASTSTAASNRTIVSYSWNFDDGTTGSGVQTTHAFTNARSYSVRLTVTDDAGQSNTVVNSVTVTASGSGPTASFVYTPQSPVQQSTTITFDASQSQPTGTATISRYQWLFAGTPDPATGICDESRAAGVVFTTPNPVIQFNYANNGVATGNHCVVLTVFDSQGNSKNAVRPITITP